MSQAEEDFQALSNSEKRDLVVKTAVEAMYRHVPHMLQGNIDATLKFVGIEAVVNVESRDGTLIVVLDQGDLSTTYTYPWGIEQAEAMELQKMIEAIDNHSFRIMIDRGPGGVSLRLQDSDPKNADHQVSGESLWDVLRWLQEKLQERDAADIAERMEEADLRESEDAAPKSIEDTWSDVYQLAYESGHRVTLGRAHGHWHLSFDDVKTNHSTLEGVRDWLKDRLARAKRDILQKQHEQMDELAQQGETLLRESEKPAEEETPVDTEAAWIALMNLANRSRYKIMLERAKGMWNLTYGDRGAVRSTLGEIKQWLEERVKEEKKGHASKDSDRKAGK